MGQLNIEHVWWFKIMTPHTCVSFWTNNCLQPSCGLGHALLIVMGSRNGLRIICNTISCMATFIDTRFFQSLPLHYSPTCITSAVLLLLPKYCPQLMHMASGHDRWLNVCKNVKHAMCTSSRGCKIVPLKWDARCLCECSMCEWVHACVCVYVCVHLEGSLGSQ